MSAVPVLLALLDAGLTLRLGAEGLRLLGRRANYTPQLSAKVAGTREALTTALQAEPDARERLLRLGAEHPGGLVGRFGPATAGALLAACHAWEAARDAEADDWDPGDPASTVAALATLDTMMAAALAAEVTP